MFRKINFELHWFFGITAGIILAVVGVTGGMLSFESQIIRLLNPGVITVTPSAAGTKLTPDELMARVREAAPGRAINSLVLYADPGDATRVNLASSDPEQRRGENRYVDPYSGTLLGDLRGEAFFRANMQIHRWLWTNEWLGSREIGKHIVGASTVLLIFLCLNGIYLRWPRKPLNWRVWLTFNPHRKGRGFIWDLHAVCGVWVLLFYLLASFTGLYWSYDWYRDLLHQAAGVPRPVRMMPPPAQTPEPTMEQRAEQPTGQRGRARAVQAAETVPTLDPVWQLFLQTAGDNYSQVSIRFPRGWDGRQPLTMTYMDAKPAHERAFNRLEVDPAQLTVLNHDRYADGPLRVRLIGSMLPLHSGSYFGLPGLILMMVASLLMPLFTITGWMLYLDRRRLKKLKRQRMECRS